MADTSQHIRWITYAFSFFAAVSFILTIVVAVAAGAKDPSTAQTCMIAGVYGSMYGAWKTIAAGATTVAATSAASTDGSLVNSARYIGAIAIITAVAGQIGQAAALINYSDWVNEEDNFAEDCTRTFDGAAAAFQWLCVLCTFAAWLVSCLSLTPASKPQTAGVEGFALCASLFAVFGISLSMFAATNATIKGQDPFLPEHRLTGTLMASYTGFSILTVFTTPALLLAGGGLQKRAAAITSLLACMMAWPTLISLSMQMSNQHLFKTDCDRTTTLGIVNGLDSTQCNDLHAAWTGYFFQLIGVTLAAVALVFMSWSSPSSSSSSSAAYGGYSGAPLSSAV